MLPRKERRSILRTLEKAQKRYDPTQPLVLEGGYVHKTCKGSVRGSENANFYFCTPCNRPVPSSEVKRGAHS